MTDARFQRRVLYLLADVRQEIQGLKEKSDLNEKHDVCPQMNPIEELRKLDNSLQNEDKRKKLIAMLSKVGGDSLRDNVKRILERLITNALMSMLNRKGQNRSSQAQPDRLRKIAFSSFSFSKLIPVCVSKKWSATDSDVEKMVGDVLKYAPNRKGGSGRNVMLDLNQ